MIIAQYRNLFLCSAILAGCSQNLAPPPPCSLTKSSDILQDAFAKDTIVRTDGAKLMVNETAWLMLDNHQRLEILHARACITGRGDLRKGWATVADSKSGMLIAKGEWNGREFILSDY